MTTTLVCRSATESDIEALFQLIQGYAVQGIMLPRTREMLATLIPDFVVVETEGELVGCGSLCQLGQDLVEVRSLGISPGYQGRGIGSMIMDSLMQMAKERELTKVMALTYEVRFFEKNGFTVVEKEIFPEKVWKDCIHCSKQHCCDEIAVLKVLN
ncbi:N-acetyltransferase [Paenibacillus agilis]|uniref:N-acetyltransferase n=1 Tax=Paenibacillus agilis TaxID=3020863 RepID=A0A559J369_9BACL|nr:N-acetyltransferase [Paenibacillus agilis]TVX94327.1 N-acetyltransferase [Paenibacillus agilis]